MNKKERCDVVRAMELLAQTVIDERVFTEWLAEGTEGDITPTTTDDDLERYIENDDRFGGLLYTFLHLMHKAYEGNGLCADEVQSEYYDVYNDIKGNIGKKKIFTFSEHSLTISGEEDDLFEFALRVEGSELSNIFTDLAFKIRMELDDGFREEVENAKAYAERKKHERES